MPDSANDHELARLVSEHGAALERYLTRTLDNPDDAAEVAQEAFLRIHRLQLQQTEQQLDNVRAFLFQVASNLALDQLRRRKLHLQYLNREQGQLQDGEPVDLNASGVSPEDILTARRKLQDIYAAVDELPLKVKQAFLLHRRSGMSYKDIAREMDVSISSVEKYILEALKHCRKRLARYYNPDR